MRGAWERLKSAGTFVLRNADAFLAMGVALGVGIALIVGHPSPEVIDGAILGLLGTTALAILRDRGGDRDLSDIRQLAGDAISDRPYEVIRQTNEWDLGDREHATVRMTEQIRFTRNDVSTLAHWSQGDGSIARYDAKWRRSEDSAWIPAKKIHVMPIEAGEKVIYSLEEEHCRGDMLDWCIERDAVGRFPQAHEQVSLEARTKSDHPRVMRVTWPSEAAPTNVELRFKGKPAQKLSTKRRGGRVQVDEKIAMLAVGEKVVIAWTW